MARKCAPCRSQPAGVRQDLRAVRRVRPAGLLRRLRRARVGRGGGGAGRASAAVRRGALQLPQVDADPAAARGEPIRRGGAARDPCSSRGLRRLWRDPVLKPRRWQERKAPAPAAPRGRRAYLPAPSAAVVCASTGSKRVGGPRPQSRRAAAFVETKEKKARHTSWRLLSAGQSLPMCQEWQRASINAHES